MNKLIPTLIRFLIGELVVIVGYFYALTAGIAIVDKQTIDAFPIEILNNPFVLYAACDAAIFIGTYIAKIPFRHPGKITGLGEVIAWLVYLVVFPAAHLVMNALYLIKSIFRLPMILSGTTQKTSVPTKQQPQRAASVQRQVRSASNSGRISGGMSQLNNQLYALCNRWKGTAHPSMAVGIEYRLSHVLRKGQIAFTLTAKASIRTDYITSEYDAQKAREAIDGFMDNFNVDGIYNEVSTILDRLQEKYSDLDCEWNYRWLEDLSTQTV